MIVLNVIVLVGVNLDASLLDVVALPPSWEGVAAQPWTLLTVFPSSEALVHIAATVLVIGIGDWVSSAAHIAGLAVGAAHGYLLRSRTVAAPPGVSISSQ